MLLLPCLQVVDERGHVGRSVLVRVERDEDEHVFDELGGLGAVEALEEQKEYLLDVLGEEALGQMLGETVEYVKGEVVVGLGGDEALKDAEHGHDLLGDAGARRLAYVGLEELDECRYVARSLPQHGHEQEGKELVVDARYLLIVRLEHHGEELEGVGHELADVLLEHVVEDGKEAALELLDELWLDGARRAYEHAERLEQVVIEVRLARILADGGEQADELVDDGVQIGHHLLAEHHAHAHEQADGVLVLAAHRLQYVEYVGDERGRDRRSLQVAAGEQALLVVAGRRLDREYALDGVTRVRVHHRHAALDEPNELADGHQQHVFGQLLPIVWNLFQ